MDHKQKFSILLAQQTSSEAVVTLMSLLLTPKELDEIGKRVEIIDRLLKGDSQRSIATDLQVGIATVSRGSRVIQSDRTLCNNIFTSIT